MFFFSSRRRHTRYISVTGVQTCALPICFAIAGGFDNLIVRPALAIAKSCEKLERILYEGVLAIGRLGLKLGQAVRRNDDDGIDGFIFSFVRGTVNFADKARTLQSGLVHKELAISTVVSAVLLIFMLITLLAY